MFIVTKLGMDVCKAVLRSLAGNQVQKIHMSYIECTFCFQFLQYSGIFIFFLFFEEVGGVVRI